MSKSSVEDSKLLSPTTDGSMSSAYGEESDDTFSRSKRPQHLRQVLITIVVTLLATTALQQSYHHLAFSPDKVFQSAIASVYSEEVRLVPQYHCGNSSSEAIARGCVFDISLVGWVPKPCFEADLNQRFVDFGWRFYEDEEGTREVSLDRIAASAGTREPFWTQHGYHITHCELAWERMHRAIMSGRRLTTHLMNLEHTRHCGKMHELRVPLQKINSQILPLLNSC